MTKLLQLKKDVPASGSRSSAGLCYVDAHTLPKTNRYVQVDPQITYYVLPKPNAEYIAGLQPIALDRIRALRRILLEQSDLGSEDLTTHLYAIPKGAGLSQKHAKEHQTAFFTDLYQLILGTDQGPRLAEFMLDIDRKHVCMLLDV